MYESDASEHQAGLFGLSLDEIPIEEIPVWGINLPVLELFVMLDTQWRVGMNGATGLDYTAVKSTAEMMGFKKKEIRDMLPDIRIMENEALLTMRENQKNADNSGTAT